MNDQDPPSPRPSAGDAPLDAATAAGVIARWVENNPHWSQLFPDARTFAQQVVQSLLDDAVVLTSQRVLAEGARQANARLHALCASPEPAEREAGYTALSAYLHRHALRLVDGDAGLAADAAQNALRNVFRFIAQVDNPQAFTGWCFRILRREVVKLRKKDDSRQDNETSIDEEDDAGDGAPLAVEITANPDQAGVDDDVAGGLQGGAFWQCLEACRALGDRARRMLVLMFRENLTVGRIALLWKEKANNLHQIFFRARKILRSDAGFLQCLQEIGA